MFTGAQTKNVVGEAGLVVPEGKFGQVDMLTDMVDGVLNWSLRKDEKVRNQYILKSTAFSFENLQQLQKQKLNKSQRWWACSMDQEVRVV